jgi:hypothetical protein
VSGVKQTEAVYPVYFYPEKLPSLCRYQAYPCHDAATTMLDNKEGSLLSDVLCWICPKHKALHLGQKVCSFAVFSCSITLVPCCMFWYFFISVI